MQIELVNSTMSENQSNVLVVGLYENDFSTELENLNNILNGAIKDFVLEKEKFKASCSKFYKMTICCKEFTDKILFVGLGKKEELTPAKLRVIASKTIRQIVGMKNIENVVVSLASIKNANFHIYDAVKAFVEGIIIGEYSFDKYKNQEGCEKIQKITFTDVCPECTKDVRNAIEAAKIVGESINYARNLVNDQPNVVTPEMIAKCALELEGVDVKVYEKTEIEQMRMGAFLGVAQGGAYSPKFIHIKYAKENPRKKVALIGKSITFDSGGLDIKPPASMLNMKDDMSGSATVLAIMKALPKLNPDIEVHALIASTENMVGSKAFKPGDILRAKNNKTIEVDNTDAEGRLTLADALCYADELDVDEIIDIATLTGACMVALGSVASGIMGNNDEMIKNIIDCAKQEGENFWQLPMFDDYNESLKSDIADLKNTGSRYGGASTAACFLSNFVKNQNWAHIDIAGTAFLEKPQNEHSKGATGVGVRTLLNYILK